MIDDSVIGKMGSVDVFRISGEFDVRFNDRLLVIQDRASLHVVCMVMPWMSELETEVRTDYGVMVSSGKEVIKNAVDG